RRSSALRYGPPAPRPSASREACGALAEERLETCREVFPVRDADEALEFLVEVPIKTVDARRAMDQALRDTIRRRRAGGESAGEVEDLPVEPLRRVDGGNESHGKGARRVEARVQKHELERAAKPDQARQEERRALRTAEARLRVGPLEARALARDDQIARHRESEAARGRHAVDRGHDGVRRPFDLADRGVQALEGL